MDTTNGWTRAEALVLGELARLGLSQEKTVAVVQALQVDQSVQLKTLERIEMGMEGLSAADRSRSINCASHHQETAQLKDEFKQIKNKIETLEQTAPFRTKLLAFAGGVLALGGVIFSYLYHVLG